MLEKLCELCCTYESDDDIQVLLENLQSSIPSVRESCILVRFFVFFAHSINFILINISH
jgi:hypothetical protein